MNRCSFLVLVAFLIVIPAWSALAIPENLVLYWSFNEGRGTVAKDRSGNGNDGALEGGAAWVPGAIGMALEFNGSDSLVRGPHIPFNSQSFTHALWVNPSALPGDQSVFSQYQASSANQGLHYRITSAGVVRMGFYSNDLDLPAGTVQVGTWYHLTFWYDFDGQNRKVYINGELAGEGAAAPYLGTAGDTLVGTFWRPDRADRVPEWFNGMIDDVQVYGRALAEEEIQDIMLGLTDPDLAYDPSPADEAIDVPRDTALSWTAGRSAATHDVYFGTSFDDVNDAGRADPRGVLVSQGQTETSYDSAGLLDFGTTWYWRIDEVGAAPDNTVHKGDVWSFTTEPLAYPVQNIVATSNGSSEASFGPERTVDGSGLDADDRHSVNNADMWLADPPAEGTLYIQYEFDRLYKLHEMLVWNYNVEFELILGFGLKNVTVEYSENGTDWTVLGDVELNQATAKATYAANTTVEFGGVPARFVRLSVNSGWGVMGQFGLSEVRFLYIPAQARQPEPADGATEVELGAALTWRSGRNAASHEVYLGTDPAALTLSGTVDSPTFAPEGIEFGSTYYWQIVEVNEADAVTAWPGEVWTFSTQEYALIDGFETYNDDVDAKTTIFDTWIDGWTNDTGATVGYLNAPFAERKIVHSGKQSMPMAYDNSAAPFYSEAERTFDTAQDWTVGGADSLRLYFCGAAANSAQTLYVTLADSAGRTATVSGTDPQAVQATEWQEWRIALSEFGGVTLSRVQTLVIGVGNRAAPAAGGTGIVYIDDIGFGRPATAE